MRDRERFWVEEIAEQADKAIQYAATRDEVHLMAMLKAAENLFEATTALSEATRAALFPDAAEHADLRRVRNYYVHQYHRVDADRARLTVERHFPPLQQGQGSGCTKSKGAPTARQAEGPLPPWRYCITPISVNFSGR